MTENGRSRRAFVGVDLDDPTRDLLAAHLVRRIGGRVPGKPVPPGNWHLTLRFLGASTDAQLDRMMHELDGARLRDPFTMRFGALGAFPRAARAAVLWVGVDRGADELGELASAVEAAAVIAGFGAEERPFHAHLSIARVRPPADLRALVEEFPPFTVDVRVGEITLFESHLGRGGARYEVLERFPL